MHEDRSVADPTAPTCREHDHLHQSPKGPAATACRDSCFSGENTQTSGFSLVELLIVVVILAVLASMSIPVYQDLTNRVKKSRCKLELRMIETDINAYINENDTEPDSLAAIGRDTDRDPWGRPFEYLKIANGGPPRMFFTDRLNTDYDLYSRGMDGLTDQSITAAQSADDIMRIGNGAGVVIGTE